VVGLYGLVGAGRSELARAIIGQHRITAGTLQVGGRAVHISGVAEALERHAIGYVSEDRKQEGVILQHGVLANTGITIWSRLRGWLRFLHDPRIARDVRPVLERLAVKTPSLAQPVGALSGGNQQKVSLAKWLVAGTRILIIDEPTVGIDIKTKAYFHQLIHDLARQGTAVLVISSDMPELITLADRITVMNRYRIAGEIRNDRDYDSMSRAIMALIHDTAAAA
jgi:ribose transport system ATP-binding protein